MKKLIAEYTTRYPSFVPIVLAVLALISFPRIVRSQSSVCVPCMRPGEFANFSDSVMDVQFSDGTILRGVRSAVRTMITILDEKDQGIRLTWMERGVCRDTLVSASAVTAFTHQGIGGTQGPLLYPVAPARQIYRENGVRLKRSFVELYGILGYGGSDSSSRKIGFSPFYEGIEALVAPFGPLLGDYLSLGFGGGIMFEGSRTRFPVLAQLRFTLPVNEHLETKAQYIPDSCQFRIPDQATIESPWPEYHERSFSRADSTVFLTQEKAIVLTPFRPFVYIEGGTLFDGKFDGAGTPSNAVNPEARKPLLLGAGLGAPIGDNIMIALGYRYMQLHLATPCEQCVDRTIINRNRIHSVTLKAGLRLPW